MKKKVTKTQKKERIAILIVLLVIIIMLCIPFINNVLIGIFGYTVYAYGAAFFVMSLFLIKGYRIALPKKKTALYTSILVFLILTIHIGLTKDMVSSGFSRYIFDTFSVATPGGLVASLITCFVVVPLGYLISLILFFIITASLIFAAAFPLIIKKDANPQNEKIRQKLFERLSVSETEEQDKELQILEIKEQEEKSAPLTVEDYEDTPVIRTKEDARQLLFGDKPKPKTVPLNNYSPEELKLHREPKQKKDNPYEILPNLEAPLVKPQDEWYTNNFIRTKKTSKAKEVLLNTSLEEDYKSRYGRDEMQEKPQTIEPYEINPYSPENNVDIQQREKPFMPENNRPEYSRTQYQDIQPQYNQPQYVEPKNDRQHNSNHDYQENNNSYTNIRTESSHEAKLTKPLAREVLFRNQTNQQQVETKQEQAKPASKPQTKKPKKPYVCPHGGLLKQHVIEGFDPMISNADYTKYKDVLERTLEDFGITATVFNAIKGPTVTRYELRLAQGAGNSVNKVINLHKDLKMVLEAEGEINILAPIRGKNAIGIEIPNKKRGVVSLRETICSQEFQSNKKGINLALGKTLDGKAYIGDLEAMPHLLVAGATGTGKSVCINTIITSILFQNSPDEVKLLLIDPKKVELINYIGLPHLLIQEPLVEISEIVTALKWIREETSQRFNKFKDMRVVNINAYNSYAKENGMETIPKIVIVIDEASELMTKAKKEVEETLSSLARIGRAAGVHLIFATQSPTKDVITSEIQNNLNTKIAFAVSDYVHSQVIFKTTGAEKLLGKGDMFLKGSGGELTRIQCSYVDPEEIQNVVSYIIQNNEADFDESINEAIMKKPEPPQSADFSDGRSKPENDNFMESVKEALKIGLRMKRISTSMLQRKMEKGYNGAAKIIDYLEENGYIGAPDSSNKKREILITVKDFIEMFPEEEDDMIGIE